jgi:hypothetical protein
MDLPSSLWHGRTVVQRETPILPSAYTQSLDTGLPPSEPLTPATVRYWSDYSRVYYHPRSLIEVGDEPEVSATQTAASGTTGASSVSAGGAALFGTAHGHREYTWGDGETLFAGLDREHDLLDRDLRLFVEEADQMQGFQVMASVDDSWGGFAARYLERMRDEYGKVDIWLWALQQPAGRLPRVCLRTHSFYFVHLFVEGHLLTCTGKTNHPPCEQGPYARRGLQPGFARHSARRTSYAPQVGAAKHVRPVVDVAHCRPSGHSR